jgi:hypothetical protein
MGWSMKNTFAFSFQEYGLKVELSGVVTRHGPLKESSFIYIFTTNTARTKLHKQPEGRRATGSTVRPEDHIVFVWVAPTLEEVEEQVTRLDINVSCVRPRMITLSERGT